MASRRAKASNHEITTSPDASFPPPFTVEIHATGREVAVSVAQRIARALRGKPTLVLGLPTGRTPLNLYRELARLTAAGQADFSRASTFNLDEFLGLAAAHPGSYRSYMERHLFTHVNLQPDRIHLLDGNARDPLRECEHYERAIREAGGIDLQLLGIGANGHIGFNEPGPSVSARTHRTRLHPETRRANAMLFGGDWRKVPREALSVGVGTILRAREIILLATGRDKAACIQRMVYGPVTPRVPASFLQLHSNVRLVLDATAGASVRGPTRRRPRR
ncbi:MAG: glucosamine-6-phosphate deaminase [Acidobacteria bacterium]|nr:glucosamine-6-phosphate deaminase [Acidobacteriota bacterium]